MIARLSKRIAFFFVMRDIISKEDMEVYEYGFQLLISTILNTLTAFLLAAMTGTLIQSAIFLSVFVLMRKAAGGFHARTHFGCLCILIAVHYCFIAFIKFAPYEVYTAVSVVSMVLSVMIILAFAPVEHKNKPLNGSEKTVLRRRSIAQMIIITVSVIVSGLITQNTIMISIALGIATASCSILAAKIHDKYTEICISEH